MKIKITPDQRNAFLKALQQAEKISSRRTTLPALSAVLLTAQKDHVSIQANNLDQAIAITAPVEVLKKGRVGLVASDLVRIANLGHSIDLEADKAGATLHCAGTFKLPVLSADEFPPLPEIDKGSVTKFTSDELNQAMGCIYAASEPRDARYILESVYLNPEAKQGVSSNGNMLALSSLPVAEKGWGPILPEKACRMMIALAGDAGDFELALTESVACLRRNGLAFYTRLIEGNYPNFRQVIPRSDFSVRVNRRGLLEALDRALIAQAEAARIQLAFTKTDLCLSVSAKNAESQTSLVLEEGVPPKAEKFTVACSSRYLRDAASAMTEETLSLEFIDQLSPMAIRGGGYAVLALMRT